MLLAFVISTLLAISSADMYLECNLAEQKFVIGTVLNCAGNASFFGDSFDVTDVSGTDGYNENSIQSLSIEQYREIDQIPKGIVKYFPQLFRLSLENCGLTSISAEDLEPFPELKMLNLFDNKIQSLDSDLFKFTPQLIYVGLSSNQIIYIGRELILPLKNIENFRIMDNICISKEVEHSNVTGVMELARELSQKCPPTLTMIENHLLKDSSFIDDLNEQINLNFAIFEQDRSENITKNFDDLDAQLTKQYRKYLSALESLDRDIKEIEEELRMRKIMD